MLTRHLLYEEISDELQGWAKGAKQEKQRMERQRTSGALDTHQGKGRGTVWQDPRVGGWGWGWTRGSSRTLEHVVDVLRGTQNWWTDFRGTWDPDPHFLRHRVSVAFLECVRSIKQRNTFPCIISFQNHGILWSWWYFILYVGKPRLGEVMWFTS